jgi:pimeloyl-ACP methyl ester carboxylesterase
VRPKTNYAKSGSVSIAYQVIGDGPFDLVWVPGFVSNVEHYWEMPVIPRLFDRLASFSRFILFDKRGTGLSDPVRDYPIIEDRMDDVRAVMDAVGSTRAAFFGVSEGGPLSLLFAATYPDRTSALILYGSAARFSAAADYEPGWSPEWLQNFLDSIERGWDEGPLMEIFAPSAVDDEASREVWARYLRAGASPSMGRAILEANARIDVRHVLSTIHTPTLILHRIGDKAVPVAGARYMAERISGAKLVEFAGDDHLPFVGDADVMWDEVEEFLTGTRHGADVDRVLATVLFADIVASTETAHELGDRRWAEVLKSYYALARRELQRFRGREIDTAGDGIFASFDGPARAVRCAMAIRDSSKSLGIHVRAGLHTGECELIGDKVGGVAVHIGARVASAAAPDQILVSSTVKDLVVGSRLRFADYGLHPLKGIPGEWHLFSLAA